VTLLEWFHLLRAKWYFFVIFPVVLAAATAACSWAFLPNDYTSEVTLYVLTKSSTDGPSASTLTSSDITVSQQLANDISVLSRSDRVMGSTAKELGMSTLEGYGIDVASSTTNRVITLKVTGRDPDAVAVIANELARQTATAAVDIMDLKAVNVVDVAQVPNDPSGPNRPLYTLVALLAGLVVAAMLVVLLDLLNTTIRSPEEAEELLEMPVIGQVPKIKR
jgi:capsular polysaccharide biosynthesis protein